MSRVSSLTIGNAPDLVSQFLDTVLPANPNSIDGALGVDGSDELKQAEQSLKALGKKLVPLGNVRERIEQSARAVGISQTRAFDLWYGKARRVTAEEVAHIKAALRKTIKRGIQNDIAEIRAQLAVVEARMDAIDADFYEPAVDVLRQAHGVGRKANGRRG
jgi:hypothetical protein